MELRRAIGIGKVGHTTVAFAMFKPQRGIAGVVVEFVDVIKAQREVVGEAPFQPGPALVLLLACSVGVAEPWRDDPGRRVEHGPGSGVYGVCGLPVEQVVADARGDIVGNGNAHLSPCGDVIGFAYLCDTIALTAGFVPFCTAGDLVVAQFLANFAAEKLAGVAVEVLQAFQWVVDRLKSSPEDSHEGHGSLFADSRPGRPLVC